MPYQQTHLDCHFQIDITSLKDSSLHPLFICKNILKSTHCLCLGDVNVVEDTHKCIETVKCEDKGDEFTVVGLSSFIKV